MVASSVCPDEQQLIRHLKGGRYQFGERKGKWGLVTPPVNDHISTWPFCAFWVAAAEREGAPSRYTLRFNFEGYPVKPATGTFWDMATGRETIPAERPRGKNPKWIFRTDWKSGVALYHPYDRVAADTHADWPAKYRHTVWSRDLTVVDLLEVVHAALQSEEYQGVGA